MIAGLGLAEDLAFRPESFFLCQTNGSGLMRDPLGRIARRFTVDTRGHVDEAYGALRLDETYAFDNGELEAFRWVIREAGVGRYVLAEPQAGSGIVAQASGGEFLFTYSRASGAARGIATPRFAVRMTLIAADTVLKSVKVTVLGAPVGTLTALHRRVGREPRAY
jgi:hypothetical protein